MFLNLTPLLDPVRKHPAYAALVERCGLVSLAEATARRTWTARTRIPGFHVDRHDGVPEPRPDGLLDLPGYPVGVLDAHLRVDQDVELHDPHRPGPARAQAVEVPDRRHPRDDQGADPLLLVVRQAPVHEVVARPQRQPDRGAHDQEGHESGPRGVEPVEVGPRKIHLPAQMTASATMTPAEV